MNALVRNIVGVVAGLVIGMGTMMLMHLVFAKLVPLPEGIDFADPDSFKENIHKFTNLHFFTASLAHGIGTLVGSLIACKISVNKTSAFIIIAIIFLILGIANATDLNPPLWYSITDLIVAYVPMAWIGMKLAGSKSWLHSAK